MSEWKEKKLYEVCHKITDGSHYSPVAVNKGYPMLSVKDMREYDFDFSSCKKISNEDFCLMRQNDCIPQVGDVLVAKDGSYLKEIFCCKEYRDIALLSSIAIFRPNQDIILPDFLCYLLKTPFIFNYISKNCVSGSALPRIVLRTFKDVRIPVPDLSTQAEIAGILSSLDSKIENNRKICANLEAQAQALFKHWFIDFAPFKDGKFVESELGMIPEGWRVEKLGELPLYISDYVANGSFASLRENVSLYNEENYAYFIRNTDLKEKRFKVYVDKKSYDFLSKSVLHGGEIIISNVGDVGSVHLCPVLDKPMTLGNNIIMIKSGNIALQNYLYILFKYSYGQGLIHSITGGTAQPKFNKTDFKSLKIVVPGEKSLQEFNDFIKNLLQTIQLKDSENNHLSEIRDSILPKLMSGEIKV